MSLFVDWDNQGSFPAIWDCTVGNRHVAKTCYQWCSSQCCVLEHYTVDLVVSKLESSLMMSTSEHIVE